MTMVHPESFQGNAEMNSQQAAFTVSNTTFSLKTAKVKRDLGSNVFGFGLFLAAVFVFWFLNEQVP